MPSIGPLELIIILAIVVVLFGATRIGDIGKGMGRGIREFRRELREGQEEDAAKKKTETATTTTTVTPSDEKPTQSH
jgi:sec-independent protein translocase protein TatA